MVKSGDQKGFYFQTQTNKQTKTLNPPFVEGGTSEIFALLLDKLLKWLIDSHYLISLVITDNTSNNQRQNCFNWFGFSL